MDLDKLRDELEADEGCRYEIYLDHLGYHTFGIGHLIVKGDPEYGKEPWTQVTGSRVKEAFAHDIVTVYLIVKNFMKIFMNYQKKFKE